MRGEKTMKCFRLLSLAAAVALAASSAYAADPAVKNAPSTFKPGTYTATINGHNAPMTVKVTVSKNRIESIDTSKNLETVGVGRVALKKMSDKIIHYQSLGVDAITGASISSFALLQGVGDCLAARELIKVKVLENSEYSAKEAAAILSEALSADCVQVIGRKFVLFKQKPKESAYTALLAK